MTNKLLDPGQIIILNGAPRAGKSSIVQVIQERFDGPWMNLGIDTFISCVTPERYRPGVGLRPGPGGDLPFGGEAPELEPLVPVFYAAMYDSIAAHSRLGLDVVADVAHHGAIHPGLLSDCARRLEGLPVLFVGVRCPIEVIMERRNAGQPGREGMYARGSTEQPVPPPVLLWQQEVHKPGIYDLEVDMSQGSPAECAEIIKTYLDEGTTAVAFQQLARLSSD